MTWNYLVIAPHVIYHMCFIYIKTYLYIQYNKFVFFITHAFSRQFYSKYFDNSDQNWWPFSSVWMEPLLPLVDVNSDSRSSGRMNFELFIDWYLGLSIVRKNFGPTENPMHKRGNTLMWILKDLNSLGVNYSFWLRLTSVQWSSDLEFNPDYNNKWQTNFRWEFEKKN